MGRQQKQTAEYFPHFVKESKTLFILERRWGNDGYALWYKLLELLCRTDGHAYDFSNPANREYFLALAKLDEETVEEIMRCLVELGNVDRELWEQDRVIWVQNLVNNLDGLYSKRVSQRPTKPQPKGNPKQKTDIEVISASETHISASEIPISAPEKDITEAETTDTAEETQEPEKKPRKKKDEPPKIKYGEYVRMTEEEHQKLVDAYGPEMAARMVEVLDNYKGSKGKTYKNDYRAILSWVADRVKEEFEKKGGTGYGGFNTNRGNTQKQFTPSTGFRRAKPDDGD